MLQLKDCYWESDAECQTLVERYSGNPFALKVVASVIQDLFEGSLTEFLKYKTLILDEIQGLFDEQFSRLPELEKTILYWMAIDGEPISMSKLQQSYISPSVSQARLIKTLKSLNQRSLIETQANQFSLQPVLMEYLTKLVVEQVYQELESELALPNVSVLDQAAEDDFYPLYTGTEPSERLPGLSGCVLQTVTGN